MSGGVEENRELTIPYVLAHAEHRPWPMPAKPWVGTFTWHDLLFAHWPVPHEALRPLVPAALPLDVFDGRCWVGVIPFYMRDVRPRGVPLPMAFPEINVRTYVTLEGKPGVYFFSLDVTNWLAVMGARALYKLPYFRAEMSVKVRESAGAREVEYHSRRLAGPRPAEFEGVYGPVAAPIKRWEKESFSYFVTERYCLYTTDRRGRPYRCEIHHLPWPLQEARVEIRRNTMARACGIELPVVTPVCHFAKELRVVVWPLEAISNKQ